MALVLKDRVKETTTSVGTGTITLAGASVGYQSFSTIGNANTTYYCIAGQGTYEWEVGIGTYTASGTTLSRDTILASSNSGSVVTFSAGTKDVFVVYPAGKSVYQDSSGVTTIASLVATTADINGGTIDGTAIGGSTPAAGAFTTISASGVATFSAGSAAAPAITTSGDTNTGIFFPAADTIAFTEGSTEAMRIDSSGNVGIGTSSPTQKLSVGGYISVNSNNISADNSLGFRNRIINGGFNIAQRGTSFTSTGNANNDDTYNLDRWYVLSDGNDVVDITQTTTVPTGAKFSIGLDVETANKKFGIAQIIENANCFDAIGQTVTLSFDAKVSSTTKLDNVKCAIVAWSGTADSVTSDIISAWGVEGTNPTLIANATYENRVANLNVTTSFARYTVSAAVDTSNTTNIIVFIWSDVTDTTAGDFLHITNVQLEVGSVATPFERRPYGTELALCQRYFVKDLQDAISATFLVGVIDTSTSADRCGMRFPVPMRSAPTAAVGGTANARIYDGASAPAITSIGSNSSSTFGASLSLVASGGGLTVGRAGIIIDNTASFITYSAEL